MRYILVAIILTGFLAAVEELPGQLCRCNSCEDPLGRKSDEWKRYWTALREKLDGRSDPTNPPESLLGANQVVFLDFDSGEDGSIDYTAERRAAIQAELEVIYARFAVEFTQKVPDGDFSTIFFNEGGLGGGMAQDIDFRNLNPNDTAVMNVDGIGLEEDEVVPISVLVAAHELGHLLGLRHADMFGPIGQGIIAGFAPFYDPAYSGPQNGLDEAVDHVMVTGAFGIPFSSFVSPSWLSERSSSKITVAEFGLTTPELENNDTIETAQPLELQSLRVPNTIVSGVNAGDFDFSVSSAVVEGSFDGATDNQDVFRIQGKQGDLFNIQVLSNVPDRLATNPVDPNLSVLNSDGSFVDFFGSDAFNESEIKSPDCNLIDLFLPADGEYFIEVDAPNSDAGIYELFVYRFNGFLGDVNGDGDVNLLDVIPFVEAIANGPFCPNADTNLDGSVDILDVNSFVDLLNGT